MPIVRSNAEKNNLHVAQYRPFPATSQFTHERKPWESFFLHITVTFCTRWQLTFYIKNCVKNLPVSQLFSHEIKFSRSKFSEDTCWIGLANVLHNIDVLKEYIPFETGVQTSLDRSKKNVNQQGTDSQTAAILGDSCGDIFASEPEMRKITHAQTFCRGVGWRTGWRTSTGEPEVGSRLFRAPSRPLLTSRCVC